MGPWQGVCMAVVMTIVVMIPSIPLIIHQHRVNKWREEIYARRERERQKGE